MFFEPCTLHFDNTQGRPAGTKSLLVIEVKLCHQTWGRANKKHQSLNLSRSKSKKWLGFEFKAVAWKLKCRSMLLNCCSTRKRLNRLASSQFKIFSKLRKENLFPCMSLVLVVVYAFSSSHFKSFSSQVIDFLKFYSSFSKPNEGFLGCVFLFENHTHFILNTFLSLLLSFIWNLSPPGDFKRPVSKFLQLHSSLSALISSDHSMFSQCFTGVSKCSAANFKQATFPFQQWSLEQWMFVEAIVVDESFNWKNCTCYLQVCLKISAGAP